MKYKTPHQQRRTEVHSYFFIILLFMALIYAFGCRTPKYGCPSMADLKSHKYDKQYAWVKCNETGKVIVLDLEGNMICNFYDKGTNNKSAKRPLSICYRIQS